MNEGMVAKALEKIAEALDKLAVAMENISGTLEHQAARRNQNG